jgi:hypothetical protein
LKCGAGEAWRSVGQIVWEMRGVKERNFLQKTQWRKADWICHILHSNRLLRYAIVGKIEGRKKWTWRREGRRKNLLGDLKVKKGYCKVKEEALDRRMWRTRFGRGYGLS